MARPMGPITCSPTVGATCHVYLQQVDDPDKLRAIILKIATDLIH